MARKKSKNKNGAVEKKLVDVADSVISAAQRSQDPTLSIPVRSLANVNFNEKRGIIEMGRRRSRHAHFSMSAWRKSSCRPCSWPMPLPSYSERT